MTSKRTVRAIAGLACVAAIGVAAPAASAQTGGSGPPGSTTPTAPPTTAPTAQPSSSPSWSVFKKATWYGPGLWGRQTSCGTLLTPTTIGVAHKKLPCGTMVTFSYAGRSVTATVIDRGPFRKGYAWDLTKKTAKRVGFLSRGAGRIHATVTPTVG
ncbi:MAG TPA: septal ring lytic transglycosylase RlpA family protein [Solirubrobacterales bacterium]